MIGPGLGHHGIASLTLRCGATSSSSCGVRPGWSHGVEEQRAVLPLWNRHDVWEQRQRAVWQGTTSPQVAGNDLLVQAELARDAVERLRVQIQDGDAVGKGRRSEVSGPPLCGETKGEEEG